ncbi:MAG: bifunctional [glutamate--ammonia ligase]-adenylyl-L-tyrosine phosphorylase/[glutamate--ammonia-ligase] adenylyltransferase [Desulfuromonas sp.]|nr:MAG: bifunctional [glutamate--ammonia ligase]-adenylyl-L-tyrosine phosphorylase/[glutamate--ammonia-ligase] adenylyltransferase [Desulfuromonas sp.]
MTREELAERLEQICRDGGGACLEELAAAAGLPDARKGASNLEDLYLHLKDAGLIAQVVEDALVSSDPDGALNQLERLCACLERDELCVVLREASKRRQLLTVLGAAPFMATIMCRSREYFHDLLVAGELTRCKDHETMLGELRERIAAEASFEELQAGLRRYKAREILRIGSRDLCGLAEMAEVTAELADLASASLQRAGEICEALLRKEYGAPLLIDADDQPSGEAEYTIIGMGKLGGCELNFSSDIDLIFFYTSDAGRTSGVEDPRGGTRNSISLHQFYIKHAEMVSKALNEPTDDGFVFRVDLNLRPEGSRGAVALSLPSAEMYYESWGRSWERAALIKGRPVAGSVELGEQLLENLEPFIYRRYLDYGMLEDIKGMKQKIDQSLVRKREGEINLKLGRGGIREIEFFIQALQLINAGKQPSLRERNSLKALAKLHEAQLIDAVTYDSLRDAYIFLRNTEHRIQVVQERQTQNLPTAEQERLLLARRSGFTTREAFEERLEEVREAVSAIYRELFYAPEEEEAQQIRPEIRYMLDADAEADMVKDLLEERGFSNPDAAYEILLILRNGPAHKPLTERVQRLLDRIAPTMLQEVVDSSNPEMALLNLEKYLLSLRARGAFFALLAENREIIRLLVKLFSSSQFLSRIFIQHPEILDSLVSSNYAQLDKGLEAMQQELAKLLEGRDYEECLDLLRRYRNEEFLRIALNDLGGGLKQGEGARQLSWLAEVCLEKAVEMARSELLPRFGLPFCGDTQGDEHLATFAILGMGKLGGCELNYHSDLDIIFMYEGEGETRAVEGSDPQRFRQVSSHEYFAKLAQRIISVLTLVTREGKVYEIDTRLRPSGNQGPLVTSLKAFNTYHQESAQLWERQALTKARVVYGDAEFAARIEGLIDELVYKRPLPEDVREEIVRIRGRMENEIARENKSHLNIKTGRGGMVDVEFIVQYMQLLHGGRLPEVRGTNSLLSLIAMRDSGVLDREEFETLSNGYRFLRRLENKLRILHDSSMNELSGDPEKLLRLAQRLGYQEGAERADRVFMDDYHRITEAIRALFERHLGVVSSP